MASAFVPYERFVKLYRRYVGENLENSYIRVGDKAFLFILGRESF